MFSKPLYPLSSPSAAASTTADTFSRQQAYCRLQCCPAIDNAVTRRPPRQWQHNTSMQQHRWVQPSPPPAAAGSWQPSVPEPQEQPRRRRRFPPTLLAQRDALTMQQQQEQRQPKGSEAEGWFVEQPLGTWSQQPPAPLRPRRQQQQLDMQQPWPEQQELLDQMQQWQGQAGVGADGVQGPPVRLVSSSRSFSSFNGRVEAWFHDRRYLKPSALHAEILERSGRGQLEVEALTHLVRTSSSPRDAALALSAISAVRHVALSQGRVEPWPDRFLKAFVKMTTICDSHEVLVSAMQRPNELGFVFKHKSFNMALKHWGSRLELHKLEQLMLVAAAAGLPPDSRMAYALVRACVNAHQWEKLDEVLAWFAAQGVTQYKPAMEKLLEQAAAARAGRSVEEQ